MNNETIITQLTEAMWQHVGDEYLKKMYAISLLSIGVENVFEPLHIFCYGSPESGKTDISTRLLDIIPDEFKDGASDFSPKVLMYSNLNPGIIINVNDKVLNDAIGMILNQICDSTAWRQGKTVAVLIGKSRENLIFPPRVCLWLNANKRITEYSISEVDPLAIEGRFMVFKKEYTKEDKKNIYLKRDTIKQPIDKEKLETIKKILCNYHKYPQTINCSEDIRIKIYNTCDSMKIQSLRQIGRIHTMCQVLALINGRTEINIDDANYIFKFIQEIPGMFINQTEPEEEKKNVETLSEYLLVETIFKKFTIEKLKQYSYESLVLKFNNSIKNMAIQLKEMDEKGIIKTELINGKMYYYKKIKGA